MIIKRKILVCIFALSLTASLLYANISLPYKIAVSDKIASSNKVAVPFPSVTVTGSLTAFSTCAGTASATKTLQVSGSFLVADVVVGAPAGYEIAKATEGPYTDMLSFLPTSGTLAITTVYIRLASNAVNGASGNISFTSVDAVSQNKTTGTAVVTPLPSAVINITNPFLCSGATTNFNAGSACGTNGSLDFSGSSYGTRPLISNVVDNYTMEIWAKWDGTVPAASGQQVLFYNGHTGNGGYGILLQPTGTLDILMGNVGYLGSNAKLTPGIWQHIAIVRNAGTSKLYLNGVEHPITGWLAVPKSPNIAPGNLTSIGGGESNNHKFYGALDEAKFWTVARTPLQIQTDMKVCTESPTAGLLSYWSFNEGTGTTTADGSGNGNTLNLTGATWNTLGAPTGGTYLWDFGDGNTSTIGGTSYTYTTAGTKTVTLTTTNLNGCSSTTTQTININQSPTASITSAATTACGVVTLTASGGISYSWSGGNSPNMATNTFNSSGTYKVTVTDANGCIATATQAITVNPLPATPSSGAVPTYTSVSISQPSQLNAFTVDRDGNAYLIGTSSTLYRSNPTNSVSSFVSGLSGVSALICDASGNIYAAERNTGNIKKITPAKVVTVFASGITFITGLAFDASGNLYASQSTTGTIHQISPDGVASVFVTGLTSPSALAVAPSGDLYVIQSANSIISISPDGAVSTVVTGLTTANGIAFDASGVLHVTQRNLRSIYKITADGDIIPVFSNSSSLTFLAIDASGKFYSWNGASTYLKITLPQTMVTSVTAGGALTLTSVAAAGSAVDWYDVPVGGSPIATGSNTYTTPVLNSTTTYYTEARNTITGCISAIRTAITVIVNPLVLNRYGEQVTERALAINNNGEIGKFGINAYGKIMAYPPLLSTLTVTGITSGTATSGGLVTTDGGSTVTETGLCWGTAIDPTIANSKISTGASSSYSNTITGLTPGIKYYVRAYAINAEGTAYGSQVSFTAL